jgi:predicted CopG family antitoxin
MSKSFANTRGSAKTDRPENFKFIDGINTIRIFGNVIPRYVYWVPNAVTGKEVPLENLSFDRDSESFTSSDKDWVKKMYPALKSKKSYIIYCIDARDNKIKVMELKPKLHNQIKTAVEDLGDPTDLDAGWWLSVKKEKTGPLPINVEYTLITLKCKKESLSEELRNLIAKTPTIEEAFTRPTPEDIKKALDRLSDKEEESEDEAEFNGDDIPFNT